MHGFKLLVGLVRVWRYVMMPKFDYHHRLDKAFLKGFWYQLSNKPEFVPAPWDIPRRIDRHGRDVTGLNGLWDDSDMTIGPLVLDVNI